jgi:hypothetical protein
MKKIILILNGLILTVCLFSGCKKIFGLSLYENHEYKSNVLNPQQGITAWEYLNLPRADTLFNLMKLGIKYAGLEEEYKKPNRTYFFLTNAAISSISSSGSQSSSTYFGKFRVNGQAARAWHNYPVEQVRDLFKYHIVEGWHTHDNSTISPKILQTLRTDDNTNKIWMNLQQNNRYLQIELNNFPKSAKVVLPRTANLQMTENCVVHVLATFLEYSLLP